MKYRINSSKRDVKIFEMPEEGKYLAVFQNTKTDSDPFGALMLKLNQVSYMILEQFILTRDGFEFNELLDFVQQSFTDVDIDNLTRDINDLTTQLQDFGIIESGN